MKKESLEKFYIGIISLFILNFSYQMMLSMNQSEDFIGFSYVISVILLFFSIIIYLFVKFRDFFYINNKIINTIGALIFGVLFVSVFIPTGLSTKDLSIQTIKIIIPLLAFVCFFIVFSQNNIEVFYLKIAALCTIMLVYFYYVEYQLTYSLIDNEFASLNISYFPFLMLPTLLCFDNKRLKTFFVAIIAITIFSSFKRGGLIAFFLSITVYYTVEYLFVISNNQKITKLMYVFLIIALIVFIFFIYDSSSGGYFWERLMMLNEDEGSGRIDVYKEIILIIENTSLSDFIFGHGHDAVFRSTTQSLSAHNDFLEIFYDYGILIFGIYINLHIQLVKTAISLVKSKSRFASPFAMSYTQFLFLSLVSSVFIYPYFIFLTTFWAMVIGVTKRETVYL